MFGQELQEQILHEQNGSGRLTEAEAGGNEKGQEKKQKERRKAKESCGCQERKKEEKEFPPEKKGGWTMKKQRQGEADNPGPWDEEVDSEEDVMPALIQEEDSDIEYDWQEMQDDTNEDNDAEKTRKATIEGVWRPGPFGMVHDGGGRPTRQPGKPARPAPSNH